MLHGEASGLVVGAVLLGAVHGIEPGHGWPVAASYALDRSNTWLYGLAASAIIGVGHLVSSVAMVLAFFYAKGYFDLTRLDEPVTLFAGVQLGGPISLVAGVVLVLLGVREYRHGHTHGSHGDGHGDEHGDGDAAHHDHGHDHRQSGLFARVAGHLPVGDGPHDADADTADRGLLGIAWFAFLLGFAHEEEFEIIALCTGSDYCLELMTAYAITVVAGIVGSTMLLIGGYHRHEAAVERFTPYLPAVSAAVLIVMGLGFIVGVF